MILGQLMSGFPHGQGMIMYENKEDYSFTGLFQYGELQEEKVMIEYPNGDVYEGSI